MLTLRVEQRRLVPVVFSERVAHRHPLWGKVLYARISRSVVGALGLHNLGALRYDSLAAYGMEWTASYQASSSSYHEWFPRSPFPSSYIYLCMQHPSVKVLI